MQIFSPLEWVTTEHPENVFPFREGCDPHTQGPLVPSSVQKMEKEGENKEQEESCSLPVCFSNSFSIKGEDVPSSAPNKCYRDAQPPYKVFRAGNFTWELGNTWCLLQRHQNIHSTHNIRSSDLTVFKWTPCTASSKISRQCGIAPLSLLWNQHHSSSPWVFLWPSSRAEHLIFYHRNCGVR